MRFCMINTCRFKRNGIKMLKKRPKLYSGARSVEIELIKGELYCIGVLRRPMVATWRPGLKLIHWQKADKTIGQNPSWELKNFPVDHARKKEKRTEAIFVIKRVCSHQQEMEGIA